MSSAHETTDAPAAPREARFPLVVIQALGVGLALAGQLAITVAPTFTMAAFAAAALLFIVAERVRRPEPEPAATAPERTPVAVWMLLAAGTLVCAATGVSVRGGGDHVFNHTLWALGLLLFAAAAFAAGRPRLPRFDRATAAALAAVAIIAGLLIFWNLTSMPPEVHGDDAEVGNDAIRLLEQRFDLFTTGWFELPMFHAFPTAVGLKIAGVNLAGLRGTSAVLGFLSVLLVFAVARRLWGLEVALLSALLLASSRFFIHLSRTGYHYIDTPFVSILAVFLLLRLWYDFRLGAAVWCGILLGVGIQTYYATRLAPVLLAATFLLWLAGTPWARVWTRSLRFVVLVIAAAATAAPMIGYFSNHWDAFMARTRGTSIFSEESIRHLSYGYRTDDFGEILAIQTKQALTLFNLTGDTSVQYSYRGGLLEPVSAAFFILGLAVLLARPLRRRNLLVLLWLAVPTFAGAALTIDTPFYPRISGIMPFVAITVALGLHSFLCSIREALAGRTGRIVSAGVTALVLLFVFANNLWTYFVEYAPNHRHSPAVDIASFVHEYGQGKTTFMVGGAPGFYIKHGTVRFLTHGFDTRDIEDLDRHVAQRPLDPGRSVFIVMPKGAELIPRLEELVGPVDTRPYHNIHGVLEFIGVVPRATTDPGAPLPEAAAPAPAEPGPFLRAIGLVRALGLALVAAVQGSSLAGYGVLVAVLIALGVAPLLWARRHGVTAGGAEGDTTPALTLRPALWFERLLEILFGPSPRHSEAGPPRWLIYLLLLVVVGVASWLRLTHLADLPAGLFCDEAGLGYNSFSLWETGKDETGKAYPLYVWSFGVSFKNPVFIYSGMLPIALGGLNDFTVRVTSAAYGIATVIALFFLGRALLGAWAGLLAAALLAVLPWHIHFSRIAFELITFPFFFIVGFTLLVRWAQGRRTLPAAMFFLGFALYTYVPAKLFVPLFVAVFSLLFLPELLRRWRESLFALVVLIVTIAPVITFDLANQRQSSQYFRNTSILGSDAPPEALARQFVEHYQAFFSQRFLFESGDPISRHSVPGHGELYPFLAPLLLLGIVVCAGRRQRLLLLPLVWLAFYPVAAALMTEIPTASRAFIGAPAFALLAAIGAAGVVRLPSQLLARPGAVLAVQGALLAAGLWWALPAVQRYWHLYTETYPRVSAKSYTGFQYGHRDVVQTFLEFQDEYDQFLLTPNQNNQPQSFLLFYSAFPPAELHRGGLAALQRDLRMRVASPEDLSAYGYGRRRLWAVTPDELRLFADYEVRRDVVAPDGTSAFLLVDVRQPKSFVHQWRIAGPYPIDASPPPPSPDDVAPQRGEYGGKPWRSYALPFAAVRLNDWFHRNADNACAWAVAWVDSDLERPVGVFAGFDDKGEIWINGERVPMRPQGSRHESFVDTEAGQSRLREGRNFVAVKTCDIRDDWKFYFRLGTPEGAEIDALRWQAS